MESMFRRSLFLFLAVLLLSSSLGCDIADLHRIQDAVNQLDKIEQNLNKDLQARLEQLKQDLATLIDQAAAAGGQLEDKIVQDFIRERQDTIRELVNASNEVLRNQVTPDLIVPIQLLPGQLENVAAAVTQDTRDKLMETLILAFPFLYRDVAVTHGTLLEVQATGTYQVSFLVANPENLYLRLWDGTTISPKLTAKTWAYFELPASTFTPLFPDSNPDSILSSKAHYSLLDLKSGKFKDRSNGDFVLLPMFHLQYSLDVKNDNGTTRSPTISQGLAIVNIMRAIRLSLESEGAAPIVIASRQAELLRATETYLPYGYSEIDLLPSENEWSLTVTDSGKSMELNRHLLRTNGVQVDPDVTKDVQGRTVTRLRIMTWPSFPGFAEVPGI